MKEVTKFLLNINSFYRCWIFNDLLEGVVELLDALTERVHSRLNQRVTVVTRKTSRLDVVPIFNTLITATTFDMITTQALS